MRGTFSAHVYYRQKYDNFVIHHSDRAHKCLQTAEDAGPVIDGVEGCPASPMLLTPGGPVLDMVAPVVYPGLHIRRLVSGYSWHRGSKVIEAATRRPQLPVRLGNVFDKV